MWAIMEYLSYYIDGKGVILSFFRKSPTDIDNTERERQNGCG